MNPPSSDVAFSKRKGVLVIRAGKHLCGSTVNLCSGFDVTAPRIDFATNIVEHWTGGVAEYIGEFPSLEPGNYTAYVDGSELIALVTVSEGCTAEIDWRHVPNQLTTLWTHMIRFLWTKTRHDR